jgi:hypothetical protein
MTETHVPPSQQLCQGPVPKPGEPVVWTKGTNAPAKAPAKAKKIEETVYESPKPVKKSP